MGKNPTQSDVARLAGVSRGLVSLALSGSPMVAEDSRRRILAAAEELGYTRDLGAATLAAGRSQVLGVVLPDLRNPFFEDLIDALQRRAHGAADLGGGGVETRAVLHASHASPGRAGRRD